MQDEYGVKFYKNDDEIEIDEIPDEYLNGIIQCCRNEIISRERWDRVLSKMVDNINQRDVKKESE